MTLLELSVSYAESAVLLRGRIAELNAAAKEESDPERVRHLQARIRTLRPLLQEMRELSVLTARYYDRSYHKHEGYTL